MLPRIDISGIYYTIHDWSSRAQRLISRSERMMLSVVEHFGPLFSTRSAAMQNSRAGDIRAQDIEDH